MRDYLLTLLALCLSSSLLHAEDAASNKFYDLAGGCTFQNGGLEIEPYLATRLWHNGVPLPFSFNEDQPESFIMRTGDTVDIRTQEGFYRYRLDRLTSTQATFTRFSYDAYRQQLSAHSWRISSGPMKATEHFAITPPLGSLVDYATYLEVNSKKSSRTK